MKRTVPIFLFSIMIVLGFNACDNDDKNILTGADLSKKEEAILVTTSDESFVFDFHLDSEYEEVSVQVEKYELGELIEDETQLIMHDVSEGEGSIIITSQKRNDDMDDAIFNIGISSKGSTGSTSYLDDDVDQYQTIGSIQEDKIL